MASLLPLPRLPALRRPVARRWRSLSVDKLVGSGRSEASWVEEIVARITALPGYDGPTLDGWRKVWANQQHWRRPWPDTWPYASAGDPSTVQFRFEL